MHVGDISFLPLYPFHFGDQSGEPCSKASFDDRHAFNDLHPISGRPTRVSTVYPYNLRYGRDRLNPRRVLVRKPQLTC